MLSKRLTLVLACRRKVAVRSAGKSLGSKLAVTPSGTFTNGSPITFADQLKGIGQRVSAREAAKKNENEGQ